MFTLKLTFMQIFIEIGQNLDFDPYLTPIWPYIWWGQRVLHDLKAFCVYCILQIIIQTIFSQLDDVLVSEGGLVTTFTRRNEFWSPFEVKMTPNQIFFVGVHVHPKTDLHASFY